MIRPSTASFPYTASQKWLDVLGEESECPAGRDGARKLADATDNHDHETVHDVALSHVGIQLVEQRHDRAGESRQAGAKAEGQSVDPAGGNSEGRGNRTILGRGAQQKAEACALHQVVDAGHARARRTR